MDLAAAFPQDFGQAGMFYDSPTTRPPPMVQQNVGQPQNQGQQPQGQSAFSAVLQQNQVGEQPVVYGAAGVPQLPQLKQGFTDFPEGGTRVAPAAAAAAAAAAASRTGRRELQAKKAVYTVFCFLLALALDRIVGLYLEDYLANAGFEPNRTFLTWMVYPAILVAGIWVVLR